MTAVELALRELAQAFGALDVEWALVGGLAVSARGEPRVTRDVDVAVAVSGDPEAERIVADLRARGYHIETVLEQTTASRMSTVRLRRAEAEPFVDLLFASSGIEPEIVRASDRIDVGMGLVVPVATRGHLIAMKLLSRDDESRYQDAVDLQSLLARASATDLTLARAAAELIVARGFHRGRNLVGALDALLAARRS
jgi:hypothetical protein